MKKTIVSLLVAMCVVGAVFAGGPKETGQEQIELVYWSHYGQSPIFVQSFAEAANLALQRLGYENVTCKAEVIEYSGYETKYLSAFASGNGPDMFLAAPSDWAMDGGKNPIALPLNEATANAWDDALAPLYFDGGTFHGVRYGFPAEGGSIQFIYINEDYMIEAGLDPKTDYPKTMDELKAIAKKMTKYDESGKIIRSGYAPRYLGGGGAVNGKFMSIYHQYGARMLSEDLTTAKGFVNSDISKQAFQDYQDMVYVDKSVNLEFGAPETAFQSGQTAMITREGWFAGDCDQKAPNINYIIVPFISQNVAVASTQGGSAWANMINAKGEYTDICMELFNELAKPEYDVILHEAASYPPVLKETMSMENKFFATLPFAEATIASLDRTPAPAYGELSAWSTIASMMGDTMALILGGADVSETLDEVAEKIDVVLSQ